MTNPRDKSQKLRYDLIPPEVLEGLAEIYTVGAKYHGERDWENKPYDWSERFASAERHGWGWFNGIDIDPDGTGLNQAQQALFNWATLYTYIKRGIGKDDRPFNERRQREATAKAQEQICKDVGGPSLQITYPERRPAETDIRQDQK